MEVGHHWGMTQNGHIIVDSNSYEKVKTFRPRGKESTEVRPCQSKYLDTVSVCLCVPVL